jgi:predicted GH43/DUF377 family glycosyl hydrolase
MNQFTLEPTGITIHPDNSRVIVRAFIPDDHRLIARIINRALTLSTSEITERLEELHRLFDYRHPALTSNWNHHYQHVSKFIKDEEKLTAEQRLYIGALFSGEYTLESTALFNPSIVPHPDQSGVAEGALRFIMSLRATGEGHISSIAFRTGTIHADGAVSLDQQTGHVSAPDLNPNPTFKRTRFFRRIHEMNLDTPWTKEVMESLSDTFTRNELNEVLHTACGATRCDSHEVRQSLECIQWLSLVNYEVHFDPSIPLVERIIFPNSPSESNGIEDARFVRFIEEDGEVTYYATYTAYNGHSILPQLLETNDFLSFRVQSLDGSGVHNKGMALFPRRIGGKFAMISRQDDENLYLMLSEEIRVWDEAKVLRHPETAWEAIKIGNCGSPIETTEGWLLLTHGVGAMRRYCIGALLLDLDDPSIVLGHLAEPLIEPNETGRNGYVPNVVYTCGAMLHAGKLILPYGLNDSSTTLSTIDLNQLLQALLSTTNKENQNHGR